MATPCHQARHRLLDLDLHQLATHTSVRPRVGRAIRQPRAGGSGGTGQSANLKGTSPTFVEPDVRRGRDETADLGRMLRRCVERHSTAERVAHEVRTVEPEVVDQCGDVVGHEPDVNGSIDVAVRPCPCKSTATTWWSSAGTGRTGPNISPDPSPPWSRIIGRPLP
jgi:hypothetical protein